MSDFYKITVSGLIHKTGYAIHTTLKLPNHLQNLFEFKSGQYLTLRFIHKEQEIRQSCTILSSPESKQSICILILNNNLHFNSFMSNISIGDVIEVSAPRGSFCVDINSNLWKSYFFFAEDNGIHATLILIIEILNHEPKSIVFLIYSTKNQNSILLKNKLNKLSISYSKRFNVNYQLSKPKIWLWFNNRNLKYNKGQLDNRAVRKLLSQFKSQVKTKCYYICASNKTIKNIIQTLKTFNVEENNLIYSNQNSVSYVELKGKTHSKGPKLIAHFNQEKVEIDFDKNKTILATLLSKGYNPPHSCESGTCSLCRCILISGQVKTLKHSNAKKQQLQNNYILSCQSIPTTESVEVEFK